MNDKKDWADEPTPLVDGAEEHVANLHNEWACKGMNPVPEFAVRSDEVRDLERRLRHAWKLVNSLRIDAMHSDLDRGRAVGSVDPELLEQRLADIEEALQ